jgi:hypothetical protein
MDHEWLIYFHSGCEHRLTDVFSRVVEEAWDESKWLISRTLNLSFPFPMWTRRPYCASIFFGPDSPEERIPIREAPGGHIRLAMVGRFVMCLRPNVVRRDRLYRQARYPFAMLVSVGGRNAITSEVSTNLIRSPQNYFATPSQGGIDGYYVGGRVYPFRSTTETPTSQIHLEVKVFPMKCKAFAYFKHQLKLIPGWGASALRGVTLLHGGERQCEPIYEDICSLGDWDKDGEERVIILISSGS